MFKKYFLGHLSLALILCTSLGFSQELPPIIKYSPVIYGAGNQNWMVSQDKNHFVFFANNNGLLEFNGSNWTLYPSPNETILRSVKVINNRIYTGCYMDFGYWLRKADGKLKYTSLSKPIQKYIQDDEQFWNIIDYEQWILFQSLNKIFIYDTKTGKFAVIKPKSDIVKAFKTSNAIYFQTLGEGLFEIENGRSKLISNNSIIKTNRIVSIFAIDEGLLIETQNNGFYKLIGTQLSKFSTEADSEIEASSIYSSQILSDGSFALGTVSNGIYILTKEGKVKYHITQNRGLSNNTILSLFEDFDKNLWIGLDNGINCINIQSPVQSYSDNTGMLGTVYTSKLFKGKLYIGTNQGLFYKSYKSDDQFQFVNGTKGQVWSLFEYEGDLFCGHNSGTFLIDDTHASLIFSQSGTWKLEPIHNHPDLLAQGNYYGLSILEKRNGQWMFRNKISGFNYSSRYFSITNTLEVYVSHEYKGIFRFQLDKKLTKTPNFLTYDYPKKGKNSSLIKYNNAIYYAYKEGVFKLNPKSKVFEKNATLSSVFDKDEYTSGKLIVDESNKIWLFSKNYMHYFSKSKLSNELKQNGISIPSSLTNSLLGYENVTQLNNSEYAIGTTDGYYTININDLSFKNYTVFISDISVNKLNEKSKNISILDQGKLHYEENNITFSYTVAEYNKYINAEYQYKLEGFEDIWSQWSTKPTINFKNLPSGDYKFIVRSKIANSNLENIASYTFSILKPWYLTHLALLFYFTGILYLAFLINKRYKKYYEKQEVKLIEENNLLLEIKELESEQQLMKVRNEQLSQDVDAKSKELAFSTMSLIKKDELLAVIKEDLKKTEDEGNKSMSIKSMISTITKNINHEDSWNTFKEAFDTVDKDFLKKLKSAHSPLTPNDLRLCAYLRLNLSSKEIAPLLNISVRSVEIKRYRLRKKMNLNHENGLVEYILSF